MPPDGALTEGLVLRSTGSWYDVRLDDGDTLPARARGKLRLQDSDETNPVAVGDRVTLRLEDDGSGLITGILPRHNKLSRRAAGRRVGREHVIVANVDRAWCVQAAKLPQFVNGFVDRFLAMAEQYGVPAGLVINKVDLIETDEHADAMAYWFEVYARIGYPVIATSTETADGLAELAEGLAGRVSVLSGPSGVGKSSLLRAIDPTLDLKTNEVSQKTRKGRHTTTFATLLPVKTEPPGWVVDTPGIREFGIWDMDPVELSGYFVEMRPHLTECRFQPCTHDHEPDCAVKAAVEDDEIAPERYLSYLNILQSLREGHADVGR
jgi:ribosome biogenesis GTPase